MADTRDDVMARIEDNASEHGYNATLINRLLAAGKSANRIAEMYWRKRATQTINLVNTSEAGSTRGLEAVYPRMIALAEKYAAAAEAEENASQGDTARYARFYPITRA